MSLTLARTAEEPKAPMDAVCPACDGRDHSLYIAHRGLTLLACRACATVHLHPRPSPATIESLYSDAYAGATESYFAKVEKKLRRSRRRMAALTAALAWPNGVEHGQRPRFLDIGCNGGFMVEAARERGFDAHGLDIDPVSIAYARQTYPANAFALATLDSYEAGIRRFDLIACSEVIEHVPDPAAFLARARDLLAPGGLLFLTTPDISHWRRPRDVTRWDGFCPPSHCVYFTPRSLTDLLRRLGFRDIRRRLALKPGIKLTCRKPASN